MTVDRERQVEALFAAAVACAPAERDALLSYMEHLQAGIEPDAFSATEAKIARARRLGEACAARERRHLGVFQPDPEPLLDQPALRAQAERIRLQAQRLRESCLSQPRVPDMRIVP